MSDDGDDSDVEVSTPRAPFAVTPHVDPEKVEDSLICSDDSKAKYANKPLQASGDSLAYAFISGGEWACEHLLKDVNLLNEKTISNAGYNKEDVHKVNNIW